MEPGVPFALLGAVQLLALAGWVGLAGAAVAQRGRRPPGLALPVLLTGAFLLVVADARTALGFDEPVDDSLARLRALGLLGLAAGLALGALRARDRPVLRTDGPLLSVVALPGVVVPLGAATTPALLGGLAGLAAAGAALGARRDRVGVLLALSLLAAGASATAAAQADADGGALAVLLLRGASAGLLLAALALLARLSLLSKVVTAILGGVLVMAVAAVGVVGTVVVDSYDQQDRDLVREAAEQQTARLNDLVAGRRFTASVLAAACGLPTGARPAAAAPAACAAVLGSLPTSREFVVRVRAAEGSVLLAEQEGTGLTASEVLGLGGLDQVKGVLRQGCRPGVVTQTTTFLARLTGARPSVVALAVTPEACAGGRFRSALIYGTRLDDTYAGQQLAAEGTTFSILVGDRIAASNASVAERAQVERAARALDEAGGVGEAATVAADGLQPTFRFQRLEVGDAAVGAVVIGRNTEDAREAQQDALRYLVGTALLTTLLVGALGLVLGRRTVQPVRRLTAAAEQVAAGDLSVRTAVGGRDEVGTLSRAFDSMTGALAAVNEDLRRSAERQRTILVSVSEGLVATDADGLLTSANPAALGMAGLRDEAEALGRPLSEVLTVRAPGGDLLALGAPLRETDGEVVRVDGTTTPVRVEVTALTGGDGGVVVVLRDTSREREVERMKTEFLSNVSHELRTPLTPIRGYADLLAHRKGLTPEQVEVFAGTILSESLKMNRVVDLLVDVAAIEAGRVHASPRAVPVAGLLDERLAAWRARAPERAGDLRRRVARGLPPVHVDPEWLAKALDELVDNALKHTPPGTPVTLGARAGLEGHVRVSVADRGPGIAEADQALLFTSFEQVDGSATRRVGGLGLGLSFVSRLAEHGGYPLSVVSAVGKGAEFSLDLPASTEAPSRARRATRAAVPARGSRAARRPARGPGPAR